MRISDWSSDVCSSDLLHSEAVREIQGGIGTGVVFNDVDYVNNNCSLTLCAGLGNVVDYGAGKNDWFDVFSAEVQVSGRVNDLPDWIIGFFTEEQNTNMYMNKTTILQTQAGLLPFLRGFRACGRWTI